MTFQKIIDMWENQRPGKPCMWNDLSSSEQMRYVFETMNIIIEKLEATPKDDVVDHPQITITIVSDVAHNIEVVPGVKNCPVCGDLLKTHPRGKCFQ